MPIQLTCKMGTHNTKVVEVESTDPLHILLNKLNISDKNTKFLFNGRTYSMSSIQTFQEIGLTSNQRITINNQAIAGFL